MKQSHFLDSAGERLVLALTIVALTLLLVPAAYGATLEVGAGKTYATIPAAISAAASGDTIHVYPGTYAANISVNKSLTILGDPGDSAAGPAVGAPIIDGGGAVKDAFDLANGVSNVTIRGFEIRNLGATGFTDGTGVGVQAWVPSTSNITVSDNWFHDVGYGVMAGNDADYGLGTHTNWTVSSNIVETFSSVGVELTDTSNSTVQGNVMHMMGGGLPYGQIGIFSWAHISQSGLTISGNSIDGASVAYPAVYMYAYDDAAPSPNLNNVNIANNLMTTTGPAGLAQVMVRNIGTGTMTGVHINNNSLSRLGNRTAVATLDATNNWWGQSSGPGAGQITTGTVTTSPWISAYTNDPAKAGQPGFWPAPVPVPTPASSTWSLVLAAIVGTGMVVWFVRKQGKLAA